MDRVGVEPTFPGATNATFHNVTYPYIYTRFFIRYLETLDSNQFIERLRFEMDALVGPGTGLEPATSRVWTSQATIANTLESRTGKRFQTTLRYAVVSFQQQRQPLILTT